MSEQEIPPQRVVQQSESNKTSVMPEHKNEPAFPSLELVKSQKTGEYETLCKGMTLRDYFAAKAMQGMLAHGMDDHSDIGALSYKYADMVLAEREKEIK